jgi:hypothetical protein
MLAPNAAMKLRDLVVDRMTYKEAKEKLGELNENEAVYNTVIAALNRQIATKLNPYSKYVGQCPTCGRIFISLPTTYCEKCGQKLKYEC